MWCCERDGATSNLEAVGEEGRGGSCARDGRRGGYREVGIAWWRAKVPRSGREQNAWELRPVACLLGT